MVVTPVFDHDDDGDDDYYYEDLEVHTGATSGRSEVALRKISQSLFFTEKPQNFSLLASPVRKEDNTLNSLDYSFDVKLTSHFEEQPGQVLDISRLVSPEKGAPSVDVLHLLVEELSRRVEALEKIVHRIESNAQGEVDACGGNNSGISSVSDDFPLDEQRKVGKRSLRRYFRLKLTGGRPATKSRVEV
jgi:hypothetical protein